jgi:hypothetical protein
MFVLIVENPKKLYLKKDNKLVKGLGRNVEKSLKKVSLTQRN